jgi:hypothetical protein
MKFPKRVNNQQDIEEMEESTREITVPNTRSPVRVAWADSEKTILRYDFNERWTWKDIYNAKNIGDAMIETVTHPVGVLFVMPANAALPDNAISNVRTLIKAAHTRTYVSIVVSSSVYVKTIYNVLRQVYKPLTASFLHTDTLEKAHKLLADLYPQQR